MNEWIDLEMLCAHCGEALEARYDSEWQPRHGYVDSLFTPLIYRHRDTLARTCRPQPPPVARPYSEDQAMRRYRERSAQETRQ